MFTSVKFWRRRLAGPVFILPVLISLFSLFIVSHVSALTYSSNVDLEYNINTTLDVAFSTNTGFIIEDLSPGTAAYSNTVTVTASSNNSDGFIMSATVGKDSSVDSYRSNNSLVYVSTNPSTNTSTSYYFDSIATNADVTLEELGDDGNGGSADQWGYCLYDTTNSTWSNYNGLPAISTPEHPTTATTLLETSTAGSSSLDMRIGASSTSTQVSGAFTNNINFTITAKVVTYDYTISYNANDGNSPLDSNTNNTVDTTNMPSNVSGSLDTGDTLLTSNSVPTRSNYLFFGWCDSTVDNTINGTITNPVCTNGHVYQASDYIKISNAIKSDGTSNTLNSIALTAMWGKYAMQNVNLWGKDITIGQEVTAIDSRDGKTYTVARLCMDADDPSNCVNGNTDTNNTVSRLWMTENLDFTIDNTKTYTHGDTDLGWSAESFDTGATWTPSVTTVTIPDAAFSYRNSDNTSEDPDYIAGWLGSTSNNTYQAEAKDSSGNEIYVYPNGTGYGIKYVGLDACVSAVMLSDSTLTEAAATADCKHYHVGNYYNWSAAVATNNTSAYTQDKYVMSNSICPAGWRLPNGLTTDNNVTVMSEFNQLLKANEVVGTTLNADGVDLTGGQNVGYASDAFVNKMIASPLYFVRSGNLGGSTLYHFSYVGYYWSSTVNSASYAYYLIFYPGYLFPARRNYRSYGMSVRCLAR